MIAIFPPSIERQLVIGDTLAFKVGAMGYDPDVWDMKFYISAAMPIVFTADPDGSGWQFNIPAADSANIPPGEMLCHLILVHKTTGERRTYAGQLLTFMPNPAVPVPKSWAAKTLGYVQTAITKLSGGTVQETSINGESYTLKDLNQLMKFRQELQAIVNNENRKLGRTKSGGGRTIYSRFGRY